MALNGTLDDFSFAEIVQMLNQGRKSGELTVRQGRDEAHVCFFRGEIAQARLLPPAPARAIEGAEVIYRLLGYSEGAFDFRRTEGGFVREIKETTDELILEGMKRLDEWETIQEEIADWNVVLRLRASRVGDKYDDLSDEARTILRLVDARRNVASIIKESGLDAAQALLTITELIALDMVEKWEAHGSPNRIASGVPGNSKVVDKRPLYTQTAVPGPMGAEEIGK